jgi:alanine racemase
VETFEGDEVEVIGKIQTLQHLASAMETIPYEVLTSISKRVQRIYLEG